MISFYILQFRISRTHAPQPEDWICSSFMAPQKAHYNLNQDKRIWCKIVEKPQWPQSRAWEETGPPQNAPPHHLANYHMVGVKIRFLCWAHFRSETLLVTLNESHWFSVFAIMLRYIAICKWFPGLFIRFSPKKLGIIWTNCDNWLCKQEVRRVGLCTFHKFSHRFLDPVASHTIAIRKPATEAGKPSEKFPKLILSIHSNFTQTLVEAQSACNGLE